LRTLRLTNSNPTLEENTSRPQPAYRLVAPELDQPNEVALLLVRDHAGVSASRGLPREHHAISQEGGRTPVSSSMRPPSSKGCRAHARVAAEPSSTVSVTHSNRAMTRVRQLERPLADPRSASCRPSPPAVSRSGVRNRLRRLRPTTGGDLNRVGLHSFRAKGRPGQHPRSTIPRPL
jgi:hypothetical protein